MIDRYLVGREPLTKEEEFVLGMVKQVEIPIGEHEFHMMINIASHASGDNLYQFEPKLWKHIDERYQTKLGSLPYCERLHGVIDSLVWKNYLARSSEEPIKIFEDEQLKLF
jgi:hypothetical protein